MRPPLNTTKVEYILQELCTVGGYCLPQKRRAWLQSKPPTDIDTFADAVMRAEGLDPDSHKRLREGVLAIIAKHWKDEDVEGSEQDSS